MSVGTTCPDQVIMIQENTFITAVKLSAVQEKGFTTQPTEPILQEKRFMIINPAHCQDPMGEKNQRRRIEKSREHCPDIIELRDKEPIQEETRESIEDMDEEEHKLLVSGGLINRGRSNNRQMAGLEEHSLFLSKILLHPEINYQDP